MKNRYKNLRKIKSLIPEFNYNKYIIGDLDKNVYVQFIPCLKGYHMDINNNICVFYIEHIDLRKSLICPKCKKNLRNELNGLKDVEREKE